MVAIICFSAKIGNKKVSGVFQIVYVHGDVFYIHTCLLYS